MKGASRSRQRETRREQLLEVAARLFARQGIDGTSTKDLARAAGVSPGLLYHYFPSKDDLMLAVVEHFDFTPELREVLEARSEGAAREVLPRMLEGISAAFETRRDVLWLFMLAGRFSPQVKEALLRMGDAAIGLLATHLEARVEAGELRPHDARRLAAAFYHTLMMEHLAESPTRGDVSSLLDVVLHGLLPRE